MLLLLQIHFISASCENMIDGKGMLPGDVLTASNGKTVEVSSLSRTHHLHNCDQSRQAQLYKYIVLCIYNAIVYYLYITRSHIIYQTCSKAAARSSPLLVRADVSKVYTGCYRVLGIVTGYWLF